MCKKKAWLYISDLKNSNENIFINEIFNGSNRILVIGAIWKNIDDIGLII